VTAPTSGIIFIALLFFIADDLEDGWFKTLIMFLRPPLSVFRKKRKNAKQKRQDSMKKENSMGITNNSVNGASLRGGGSRQLFLRTRRNQDVESLA
jgi:hypothetical protein